MNRTRSLIFSFTVFLTFSATHSFGQQDSLRKLLENFDSHQHAVLQEKIYAHIDRSFYLTGDVLWFKLYCVNAIGHVPLDISKVAYVEVISQDNKPVAQAKIELNGGYGSGSFYLPASITSGNYLFRAYTNWMKNFSADLFFTQSISIVNPFAPLDHKAGAGPLEYDAQFFPEGGSLVKGIASKVGVRVVGRNGKGVAYRGAVLGEQSDTLAHFTSLKFGLGSFLLKPTATNYHAIIKTADGNVFTANLPKVNDRGYVLSVNDTIESQLSVKFTRSDESNSAKNFYLLIHARGGVIKTETLRMLNGDKVMLVDRAILPEGISRITIFDSKLMPVGERLYFKKPTTSAPLSLQLNENSYSLRSKVDLSISSESDSPSNNLSVAVYKIDSLESEDIPTLKNYLWLTSELKGTVESPSYYFTSEGSREYTQVAENLMLTHGWSRFVWDEIKSDDSFHKFSFPPEYRGHFVTAKVVSSETKEPLSGRPLLLSSPGKIVQLHSAISDKDGNTHFEVRQFYGTKELVVAPVRDSTLRLEVTSPFTGKYSTNRLPNFYIKKSIEPYINQRSIHMQVQSVFHRDDNDKFVDTHLDSIPFYGRADETYLLDDFTRFPTMEEVMREYVKGVLVRKRKGKFHFINFDNLNKVNFKNDPLVLIDGLPVFDTDKVMRFSPLKVKKIEVIKRKFFLGQQTFDGIVSYVTYANDLGGFEPDSKSLVLAYEGMQKKREFFSPKYDLPEQRENRTPDTRTLLYWNPEIKMTEKQGQLTFYTSDVPGQYRICIQGINSEGRETTVTTGFRVNR